MSEAVVKLDARLDMANAGALAQKILEHADGDLTLDASEVTHFGAMGLQVVRAAAKSWHQSGHKLSMTGISIDCADQLQLLGFSSENICLWEES